MHRKIDGINFRQTEKDFYHKTFYLLHVTFAYLFQLLQLEQVVAKFEKECNGIAEEKERMEVRPAFEAFILMVIVFLVVTEGKTCGRTFISRFFIIGNN